MLRYSAAHRAPQLFLCASLPSHFFICGSARLYSYFSFSSPVIPLLHFFSPSVWDCRVCMVSPLAAQSRFSTLLSDHVFKSYEAQHFSLCGVLAINDPKDRAICNTCTDLLSILLPLHLTLNPYFPPSLSLVIFLEIKNTQFLNFQIDFRDEIHAEGQHSLKLASPLEGVISHLKEPDATSISEILDPARKTICTHGEFFGTEVKGHKSRLGVWWVGEREAMKDAWAEVAAGLFFTTSSPSGLLSRAQQEYHTPCLLIHISHIPVWIKRGGRERWKWEAKTRRRRGRFDTDQRASAVEKEWGWHAVHGNT